MNRLIRRPLALIATLAIVVSGLVTAAPQAFAANAQTGSVPTLYVNMTGTWYRTDGTDSTIHDAGSPGAAFDQINDSWSHSKAGGAKFEIVDPANPKNNLVDNGSADSVGEIRGRGNYTWQTLPNLWQPGVAGWVSALSGGAASFSESQVNKRPYQIKLSSKMNVLGMGEAKTWVLLSNHADGSLMRNKVAMDLAAEFGLPYTPQARFIDLVVNGKYLGNYLLAEKTQEGGTRVNLKNAGGILVELDNNYYTSEPDKLVHKVPSGSHFVLQDAYKGDITDGNGNFLPNVEAGWLEMRTLLNELDVELKKPNPDWGKISGMVDIDSFVKFYFIQEFTENPEIARSSIYFYKDGPGSKLFAGPIWDFDSSMGSYSEQALGGNPNIFYTRVISQHRPSTDRVSNYWFEWLFKMPNFDARAKELYSTELKLPVEESIVKLARYETLAKDSAAKNFGRYQILGRNKLFPPFIDRFASSWSGEVQRLRSYMQQRTAFLNGKYANNVAANASDCASTPSASATIATPGAFNALAPCRMLDTRTGNGGQGPVASNGVVALKVTGRGGVPANASAVVMNVTVANPTHVGFITAYPAGVAVPDASNLNFVPGLVVANQVTVKVGANGVVNLKNSAGGTVHLIADMAGYFVGGTATAAGSFTPVDPARLLDTRSAVGVSTKTPIPANGTVDLQVTGVGNVASGAGAVALNVTVDQPTAAGHITVYPTGAAKVPDVSNVNYRPNQTIPNAVTVKLGQNGKITLANTSTGTVHAIVDVYGYYAGGTATASGMFQPVNPTRILDSRGIPEGQAAPGMPKTVEWKAGVARMLNNFETIPLTVAGAGGVPATNAAPTAGAVVMNMTVANPTQTGYITTFPVGATRPATSSVNFAQWQDVPNLVTVKLGSGGAVNIYSMSAGQLNIIADVAGYYIK